MKPVSSFPKETQRLEIQAYKRPKDIESLMKAHVPFSGSPRKHPYHQKKFILLSDPYSSNTFYYEFNMDDISYVEELPTLVNTDGETITMARIWIKKMSVGMCCVPFVVEDTRYGKVKS